MGTTADALRAGSCTYKLIAVIEGYPNLLTDATSAQAIAAWAGTDFTQALTGLTVDLKNEQKIDRWDPFQSGGSLTLYVPGDTFGVDTHCTSGGQETVLTASLDRDDTSASVGSTTNFGASGLLYIGTETIAYTSKTATAFGGFTRGKFSPWAAGGTGAPRFSHEHRSGYVDYATNLQPVVSNVPRVWTDRLVGLWLHRIVDGVLDVVAQAQCIFAGRLTEIQDNGDNLHTAVSVRHLLDVFKNGTVGRDQYTAELVGNFYLTAGSVFTMRDSVGTTARIANPLTVVASGAAGTNQANAGYYDVDGIYSIINSWWTGEVNAGRLYADYYDIATVSITGGVRSKIHYSYTGAAGTPTTFGFRMPYSVAQLLGWADTAVAGYTMTNTASFVESATPPNESGIFSLTGSNGFTAQLANELGVFNDNRAYLPSAFGSLTNAAPAAQWGVFLVDNRRFVVAVKSGAELQQAFLIPYSLAGVQPDSTIFLTDLNRAVDSTEGPMTIRQVFMIEASLANLLKLLCYGTGKAGYNHATYDAVGHGYGLGIPAGLLGANFEASCDALPGATTARLAVIDKTIKLSGDNGLITGDLLLSYAFPIWKNGGLQFTSWKTPTSFNSVATFDESTKAEPSGNIVSQRSVTALTNAWQKNIVKILYNRDVTQLGAENYGSIITFEDRTSIDDGGGEGKTATISLRNTYGQYAQTGAGVEALAPNFLALFTLFSRPMRVMRRSIDPRWFEGIAPGDVVLVTDRFARDPVTGARGISARPGLITRHTYTLGGATPGEPQNIRQMVGEVEIHFLEASRIYAYAPSGRIDDTYSIGTFTNGYSSSTSTIRIQDHAYSESSEAIDSTRFVAGDKVVITELDPSDPGTVVTWKRTILSTAASTATFTAALSAPAFDTTKKYAMTYDEYVTDQSSQLGYAFQAGATTFQIENVAPPAQYGMENSPSTYTASVHSDLPSRYAIQSNGDGIPRDVGYDKDLCKLLNNYHDHKSRHNSPYLSHTVLTNTAYAGGFQLLAIQPVYLTTELSGTNTNRYIRFRPWHRSSDGTAGSIRYSLSPNVPWGTSLTPCNLPTIVSSQTYAVSSTTWAADTEQQWPCALKSPKGLVFIIIEATIKMETRGLCEFTETERVQT